MADLVMKQARAIIDDRTTVVCLDIHGVIVPVDQPFPTLAGDFQTPPFHVHCRTLVGPYMPGFVVEARRAANRELLRRPKKERRKGPEGTGGAIPGPVTKNPPSGFSRQIEDQQLAVEDAANKAKPLFTAPVVKVLAQPWKVYAPVNMARDLNDKIPADEFVQISEDHALAFATVKAWTQGQEGMDRVREGDLSDGGRYLEEILAQAPPVKQTLYRGMYPEGDADLERWANKQPGDVIESRTASSFTAREQYSFEYMGVDEDVAEEFDDYQHPEAVIGVQLILQDGRAVQVGNRAGSGSENEWLVGNMVVDRVVRKGPMWVQIFVKTP